MEISRSVPSITSKKLNYLKTAGQCSFWQTSRKLPISWGLPSSVDEYAFHESFRQQDTADTATNISIKTEAILSDFSHESLHAFCTDNIYQPCY